MLHDRTSALTRFHKVPSGLGLAGLVASEVDQPNRLGFPEDAHILLPVDILGSQVAFQVAAAVLVHLHLAQSLVDHRLGDILFIQEDRTEMHRLLVDRAVVFMLDTHLLADQKTTERVFGLETKRLAGVGTVGGVRSAERGQEEAGGDGLLGVREDGEGVAGVDFDDCAFEFGKERRVFGLDFVGHGI